MMVVSRVRRSEPMDVEVSPGYTRTGGFYGRFGPGGELKFFDTAIAFNVDTTGEVPATGQLVLIPQGVTESTRVGRKCVVKSIQARLDALASPGANATFSSTYAIYVILDKQCNGAAAGATDVFTGTQFTQAMHNLANSQRFVILKKIVRTVNASSGASTALNTTLQHIEFYKKCNIPLEFSSTTGAITELRSNNIFLMASAYGTDDLVGIAGNIRVRFEDGS